MMMIMIMMMMTKAGMNSRADTPWGAINMTMAMIRRSVLGGEGYE